MAIAGDLRIVLLGKTGQGKSATGNTILGRRVFEEDLCPESVTQHRERKKTPHGRRGISIVDTPGLQDTEKGTNLKDEIEKCMKMSVPGPHVFLLVIRLDEKFTEEGKSTVKWLQQNFGENAAHYTMILFTHADFLSSELQDHIEASQYLRDLVISCGSRYHALNNDDREDRAQVNELLKKIDIMVNNNGGKCYTYEMYQKAQKRSFKYGCSTRVICGIGVGVIGVIGVVLAVKRSKTSPE